MSSPYALAAVSAVLRHRITRALSAGGVAAAVGVTTVSVISPDRVPIKPQEPNGINLFLHRVSRNQGWVNAGPPPRNGRGDLVAALPTGLNLHYVISAYGQDSYTTDVLLGHIVAALADEPVLTRAAIANALAPNPPDPAIPDAVSDSRLADQIEAITITPVTAGTEDLTRLWSAFQAPLRPSLFYDVTAVLVETNRPVATPLPAINVGSATLAATGPDVDEVVALGPAGTPITAGATMVITGSGLAGPGLTVRVGTSVGAPTEVRASQLQVPVAAFQPPLMPGIGGLIVSHAVGFGEPPVLHAASTSRPVPVAIAPTLTFPNNAVTTGQVAVLNTVPVASGTIDADVDPPVGRDQQVTLVLTEVGPPADRGARGVVLAAPANNGAANNVATVGSIQFTYANAPRGTYLARLRVDGLDSPVTRGPNGVFNAPAVTL